MFAEDSSSRSQQQLNWNKMHYKARFTQLLTSLETECWNARMELLVADAVQILFKDSDLSAQEQRIRSRLVRRQSNSSKDEATGSLTDWQRRA